MESQRRVRVTVHGRVQGVGYRYALVDQAQEQGVTGWCRNRADGGVEALFCGPWPAVAKVIAWCRQGPPLARVEQVEVADSDEAPPDYFSIRR